MGNFWGSSGSNGDDPISKMMQNIPGFTQSGGIFNPAQADKPDFFSAMMKQYASGVDQTNKQTQANRPNQTNAFGSTVNWEQGPDGQWSQKQSFGGPLAGLAGALQQQAAGQMSKPMDWGQFGKVDDGAAARDQATSAAYGQMTSRLNPMWDQRGEAQRTQLLNMGLDPGSEAAQNANASFGRDRNDAYGSAMNSAIGIGNQAGNDVFRNSMQARNQKITEALQQRGQGMGELGGLMGFLGQQGFNQAGAAPASQDLAAALAQGNWSMQDAQMKNQRGTDIIGGLGNLFGTAIGAGAKIFGGG